MSDRYDVVVIGGGLGGLTAGALLARAGRKVLLLERNNSFGGAATTYKVGDLVVEASLHETADPNDPLDPKHHVLAQLGILDKVEWVRCGPLYEVRGGPFDAPFRLPDGFDAAREALGARFPAARAGVSRVLAEMERISTSLGVLSRGRDAFRNPLEGAHALWRLAPALRGWRHSLGEVFDRALGHEEGAKFALASNLLYYHDDPASTWWIFYAVAQGGYLASGGGYVRGGSQRLSNALARAIRSAGGEIRTGRRVTGIRLDASGRPAAVIHVDKRGQDSVESAASAVAGNAAPAILAGLLEAPAQQRFQAAFADRPLSASLFSLTFGLGRPPADCGIRTYSTLLLPDWLTRFADMPRNATLMGAMPGAEDPLIAVVDYSAIDGGLGGPPFPVSVAGLDRTANWAGLDKGAYDARRQAWQERITAIIDRHFPGFADSVVTSTFNTSVSIERYLNAPQGAIYGFAPRPPAGPFWRGHPHSPQTPVPGLYLASAYAGNGGFTGAILGGANAARRILGER